MINTNMRLYDCFTYGADNEYGQPALSTTPKGKIKMAVEINSQSVQDNINFKNSTYIGLTTAKLDDSYVIQYGTEKLKVQYVNPKGRYNIAYMVNV